MPGFNIHLAIGKRYIEKQMEDVKKEPQEVIEELDEEFEDPRLQNQRGY